MDKGIIITEEDIVLILKELHKKDNIIKLCKKINQQDQRFITREKLPATREDFYEKLRDPKSLSFSPTFWDVKTKVVDIMKDNKVSMAWSEKASNEKWFFQLIFCDEHLLIIYTMFKEYAQHLVKSLFSMLQSQEVFLENVEKYDFLDTIKSQGSFLLQIKDACDTIFKDLLSVTNLVEPEKEGYKHSYFIGLIKTCVNAYEEVEKVLQAFQNQQEEMKIQEQKKFFNILKQLKLKTNVSNLLRKMSQQHPKFYKTREKLPNTKEEFLKEISAVEQQSDQDSTYMSVRAKIIYQMSSEDSMAWCKRVSKEPWYITCKQHLKINYDILIEYAKHLAKFFVEIILLENELNIKHAYFLKTAENNKSFLNQISRICDITLVELPELFSEEKSRHSYFMGLFKTCMLALEEMLSLQQESRGQILLEKLKEYKHIQKLYQFINRPGSENFKKRENLPRTREEFEAELSQAQKQYKSNKFNDIKNELISVLANSQNTMLTNGKAFQESWYDSIKCDQHLHINYNILKEYAHYLTQFIVNRIYNEKNEFKDINEQQQFLKRVQSNCAFLIQIRKICDATFLGFKEEINNQNDLKVKQHEFFMDLIKKCIKAFKDVLSLEEPQQLEQKIQEINQIESFDLAQQQNIKLLQVNGISNFDQQQQEKVGQYQKQGEQLKIKPNKFQQQLQDEKKVQPQGQDLQNKPKQDKQYQIQQQVQPNQKSQQDKIFQHQFQAQEQKNYQIKREQQLFQKPQEEKDFQSVEQTQKKPKQDKQQPSLQQQQPSQKQKNENIVQPQVQTNQQKIKPKYDKDFQS